MPKPGDGNQFWRTEATNLLLDSLDAVPDRFATPFWLTKHKIFMPEWWIAIEALSRDGESGTLFVFYDPAHNLYVGEELSLPALGTPFELPTNCRNTRRIADRLCRNSGCRDFGAIECSEGPCLSFRK